MLVHNALTSLLAHAHLADYLFLLGLIFNDILGALLGLAKHLEHDISEFLLVLDSA